MLDKPIISSLSDTKEGWVLKETDNKIYVQTIRPALFCDYIFYIETIRGVTHIFNTQREQYEITLLSPNFNYMAESLEEKMYELEEEAERKELFVGAFSHELKTPLTSIIGYSDLLRCKEMNAEQRNICAQYIFTEGKRQEMLSMWTLL